MCAIYGAIVMNVNAMDYDCLHAGSAQNSPPGF